GVPRRHPRRRRLRPHHRRPRPALAAARAVHRFRHRHEDPARPLNAPDAHLIPTYARFDVEFARGEGARLWDADGAEYLDFLTGISVSSVGHCHPRVGDAVSERTAAVLIEPIRGETGIHAASEETLLAARRACDAYGAALIFDEIQTGLGRTGTLWAYEQTGVMPDALTTAKALGGGLPIGALVTGPRLADVFQPGDHGSTFAGGPVVCAAAHAVLDVLDDDALLVRVRELGERLRAALTDLPWATAVRGRGLMVAFDLVDGGAP